MARLAEGSRVIASPDDRDTAGRRRYRPVAWGLGVIALVALLAVPATMVVATARQASAQANALSTAVAEARQSAQSGSFDTLPARTRAVSSAAQDLAATTSNWQWSLLSRFPGASQSATAVRTLATSVRDLALAAQPLADAAAASSSTLDLVRQLPTVEPDVRALHEASARAGTALEAIDPIELRFGLDEAFREASDGITALDDATAAALEAWPSLQGLLGFDGPRTYLVMLQNPAEARGSGGLFSAFMLLTLDEGTPTITEANSRKVLDELRIPVPDDIDAGERQMWGDFLTKWASFNTSADFPTTARLARAGMRARGTPVDGVVAIDPAVVAAIVAGTGPVEHAGVMIDSGSAVDFFTKGIYEDFPGFDDVDAKDELALGLLYATVDSVLKRPLDLSALAEAVPRAVDEGHLRAWVPRATEEQWLDSIGVAERINTSDPLVPVVSLNNATGGKLDAYLSAFVEQHDAVCTISRGSLVGWTRSTIAVTLENDAPRGLPEYVDVRLDNPDAPKGSTRILVTVQGPPGAVDEAVTQDGRPADYASGQAHGRPYWLAQMELGRNESGTLRVTLATPNAGGVEAPPCPEPVG
jgi:hypothetical protein